MTPGGVDDRIEDLTMVQTFNKRAHRDRAVVALTAVVLALFALPTFAAGEGGGGANIFGGDLGNVLWTLLTFCLVIFVLGKYAWGPLQDVVAKREEFIRDSLEQAKSDREAAEKRLAEYEERLAEARAEATALVEEGRRDAEATRVRLEQEAREEADKMVERAKREISIARETAVAELYEAAGHAATEIAGRIVGRELQAADHEKLISQAIEELSSQAKPN